MENLYNIAKEKTIKYGQDHLLQYYDRLDEVKKEELLNEIVNIDYEMMNALYSNIGKKEESSKKIEPIEYIYKYDISENDFENYKKLGEEDLKEGKLAVLTMAGGQGTRLRT